MAPLKDKLPKVAVPAIDKLQPVMLLDVSVPVKVKFVPVEEPEKLGATSEPVKVKLDPKTVPVNEGEAERTLFPEPVEVVTPVPPRATARVPEVILAQLR